MIKGTLNRMRSLIDVQEWGCDTLMEWTAGWDHDDTSHLLNHLTLSSQGCPSTFVVTHGWSPSSTSTSATQKKDGTLEVPGSEECCFILTPVIYTTVESRWKHKQSDASQEVEEYVDVSCWRWLSRTSASWSMSMECGGEEGWDSGGGMY